MANYKKMEKHFEKLQKQLEKLQKQVEVLGKLGLLVDVVASPDGPDAVPVQGGFGGGVGPGTVWGPIVCADGKVKRAYPPLSLPLPKADDYFEKLQDYIEKIMGEGIRVDAIVFRYHPNGLQIPEKFKAWCKEMGIKIIILNEPNEQGAV